MMLSDRRIARRNFFSGIAEIASALALCRAAALGDEAPRMTGLGFSLYGMKTLSIAAALESLAEIGYDCVELPVMPGWPADSEQLDRAARRRLRAELASRRLRLTSLMENLPALGDEMQHRANLERLRRAAELARDLTPELPPGDAAPVPLIETILGGKPGEFDAVQDRLVERLRDWAKVLAAAQVVLAIKAHVSNATQRPEQLLWLVDQVASPWVQAAYDYSHFQLQGLDLRETMLRVLPQTVFIHVKDTEHAEGKRGFLLPGEGSIDFVAMFRLLALSTYRGDVMVEVSSQVSNRPDYDPLAAARKCYAHLAEAFRAAGLRRR